MDEDAAVRANRLALLQRVAGLAAGVVELAVLEGF
jgi:glycyl-tRNA synthetase beta subunit